MSKLKIGALIEYQNKQGCIFKIFKNQGEIGVMYEDGESAIIKIDEYLKSLKKDDQES